jgi:L-rhamnose isomerase
MIIPEGIIVTIKKEEKYMSKRIETWIVEETDTSGKTVFSQPFDSYIEAKEIYEDLKNKSSDNCISMTRQTKKLLVE